MQTGQPPTSRPSGVIYLLHFTPAYKHARHYIGWAKSPRSLTRRLQRHREGNGARLMTAVLAAGSDFELVRRWKGDRNLERSLKNPEEFP